MNTDGKNYKELFDGLCKVLEENSQSLNESQKKAIDGFINVLVEAINDNWGKTVKEYLNEQKKANDRNTKTIIEKRDAAWTKKVNELVSKLRNESKQSSEKKEAKDEAIASIMGMLKSIKGDISNNQVTEAEKVRKEFNEFKEKSVLATNEAIKAEKAKVSSLQAACEAKDKQLVNAGIKIRTLEEQLKKAELTNYLESKISGSGIPAYEASLMRKRFADAKTKAEIDNDFQRALVGVQEKRNAISRTPINKTRVLEVQPNQFSESAKEPKAVDLLTESTTPQTPPGQTTDEDFYMIDESNEVIPQEDVARWIMSV